MGSEQDVLILGAARTPQGRLLGALAEYDAATLGSHAVRAAVARSGVTPAEIEEVYVGNVVSAGTGLALPRQISFGAGLPETVGGTLVNKACGSGMKSVMLAASAIRSDEGRLFVAGGSESMSRAPFLQHGMRAGKRFGDAVLSDALQSDGLWCSLCDWRMGDAAEFIARQLGVSRAAMDEYALRSHRLAHAATQAGAFDQEIEPLPNDVRHDEPVRPTTSLERLAALKPAFSPDGRVTAGNAPSLNDGAAALVLASRARAERRGHVPLARIVASAQSALDPAWIFYAPVKAIPKVLQRAGWTVDDVDLFEINEAFAAQVLADLRGLEREGCPVPLDKVNVHGGAIALGHPLGASGARVLVTLVYALRRKGLRRGLAALCLGGSEAVAMAIEIEGDD
ncbi:MAG: thiolase family protein [Anaerolineaceae bacterium]|nr:thiolase family protein [Anaerolineaceae bacterium]MDE0329305.1 thiolase family protein [Anaerolineaceae bacterium]